MTSKSYSLYKVWYTRDKKPSPWGEGGLRSNSDEVEMNKTNNSKLTDNAKSLRKNMTKEEQYLWYDFLKTLPITVNRQKVIGNYIVDFYIASAKIVIELDGSQHYEEKGIENDAKRDELLNSLGVKVLRYSNLDVNQRFESVCEDILNNLDTSSVTLWQLPLKGKPLKETKNFVPNLIKSYIVKKSKIIKNT